MKTVLLATFFGVVLFISNQARAANQADPALRVGSITIHEATPTAAELYSDVVGSHSRNQDAVFNLQLGPEGVDLSIFDMGDILTVGEKVYDVVKENQPVVTVNRSLVSVVPGGAKNWTELQGWQAPMTKVFEVTIKNLYNLTTAYMRLKVTANYGGNVKGVGHYLANVNMVPTQIYAAWGYNVDVAVETATAVNVGSSKDPIAGLGLDLRYHVHTLLSDVSGRQDYWLTGNGGLSEVK
jgi:hypothetical protein